MQRFGEHGRQFPEEVAGVWAEFDRLVARDLISPVIYPKSYMGLNSIREALDDLSHRRVYGRAVVHVSEENPTPSVASKI